MTQTFKRVIGYRSGGKSKDRKPRMKVYTVLVKNRPPKPVKKPT